MSYQQPPQGQQPQSETEVVSGTVVGVITKGQDKWQISVNTGGQYNRNLWTKDAGLVNQMMNSVGQAFDFICGVSHWQGQSGPVRSLWINGLATYGSSPQQPVQGQPQYSQPVPQPTPVPQQQPMHPSVQAFQPERPAPVQGLPSIAPMEKEERIMREAAMHVVSRMLPHLRPEERNAAGMIAIAEGMVRYFRLGPPNGQPPQGTQQPLPPQPPRAPDAPGYGYEPAWGGDPGPEQGDPGWQPPGDDPEWPS